MHTISITINNEIYNRLKGSIPKGRVSDFVSQAIEEKLNKKSLALHKAYLDAYSSKARKREADLWKSVDQDFLE